MPKRVPLWLCLVGACTSSLLAAEVDVIPHRQDVRPNRPYDPLEALQRMTVPDGFSVELVASEPEIVNPVAMTFDDRGRIWITESVEYPRKSPGKGRDRVKILEDTTGDGRADKITVFAKGLNIPTGLAIGYGGVWVVNSPDLLFMRERDGREISREVVVTGFGRTDTHELPNSLTWGPDGYLYGLNGVFNHCHIVSGGRDFKFNCALFRVHPRSHQFELFCEGTSNPWGLIWDSEGSAIISTCHWANDHVFHFVETGYYQRQAGAYPPYTLKIGSVSDHGHQKTAYCGLAYYDAEAYPEQYRRRLYTGNVHGNCINVDVLRRDGSTYVSSAEPDFLSANDAWFMPVSQKVGPDGCLYILDWYDRYHCSQDARRDPDGVDRGKGRLYRVRYQGTPRAQPFNLAMESDGRLIERLASANIFFRQRAQRLLTERGTDSIRRQLQELVLNDSSLRHARLHGLWALISMGSLESEFHQRLLSHPDAAFRAWAVRAAGNFGHVDQVVRQRIENLTADSDADVLLQVAIAAPKIDGLDALRTLVAVLRACGEDKLIPYIVWPNLHPRLEKESDRFASYVRQIDELLSPGLQLLLPHSVRRMLERREPEFSEVCQLVRFVARCDTDCGRRCLSAVADAYAELPPGKRQSLVDAVTPLMQEFLGRGSHDPLYAAAQLLAAVVNPSVGNARTVREQFKAIDRPWEDRLRSLDAMIATNDPQLLNILADRLTTESPQFMARVIPALGRLEDRRVADFVLKHYPQMPAELQPLAIDLLMQREPWARRLLDAVLDKQMPRDVLHANHLRKILESNDREAIWAVERTWGTVRQERNPKQEEVVARMEEQLRARPGDPLAGEFVFNKLCSQCHVIYGKGYEVGPDLTTNGRASFSQLVSNVFDPSLVIGRDYQVTTVVTNDGRNLSGLVAEDSDQRIVLNMQGAKQEAVPRNNVKYTRVSKLSMMPEGVESLFAPEELADLFAFLSFDKHPSDPSARLIPGAPTFDRK